MTMDREKERETELESAMYTNCLLLGLDPSIIGVGANNGTPRVGLFRHSNPKLGEQLLYFILSSLRGPKDFDRVWPIFDSTQSRDFRKVVQSIISELESQGALPRSNSRVSSLATCCGPRFVELLWQLSLHALREVHRRTYAADVVSNPLPASLTDVAFSHAATLLPVTKMGEVMLGMPGLWADDNSEAADHYTTKIGGVPDWPFLHSIIKPDLLKCDSCGEKLCLVTQIYAPISSTTMTTEERVIYIFSCIATACETKRWRALRVQGSSTDKDLNPSSHDSVASPSTTKLQDDPWAFNDEEEDDDEIDLDAICKALNEATTLASASKTKKQNTLSDSIENPSPISLSRSIDDKTPVLPCFYIYPKEENYLEDAAALNKSESKHKIEEKKDDDNDEKESWIGESYEYDRTLHADKTYLKFKKRLDVYPEHCFRYSYGGKPLLATSEAGDPGRCLLCGEIRHYEMQLMPPLLYFLQEASKNQSLENWDWTSVIVYTCSKGCAPSLKQECNGWIVAEEVVVIQTE
ncbi:hypothetical protein Lser_V15G07818 [Lactuca serriola]